MGHSKHERANSNADYCNLDLWQGEKDRKKHKRLTPIPFSSADNLIGKNEVNALTLILNDFDHCCGLSRIKSGNGGLELSPLIAILSKIERRC